MANGNNISNAEAFKSFAKLGIQVNVPRMVEGKNGKPAQEGGETVKLTADLIHAASVVDGQVRIVTVDGQKHSAAAQDDGKKKDDDKKGDAK